METWTVTIHCDNDVFKDQPATEIARILRRLARDFENDGAPDVARAVLNKLTVETPEETWTITINTGNSAFEDSPATEIARILRRLARDFENYGAPGNFVFDVNGNRCGTVEVSS